MSPTRFATDSSLELLARRLRMLGYDVTTHRGARLDEVFAAAAAGGQTVLTLSSRRPAGRGDVPAVVVARERVGDAVRAIAAAHSPSGVPWSRCPVCNSALRLRSSFEAVGEVPSRVARTQGPFFSCPSCGRWYWPGTHLVQLRAWLGQVLGREIPGPEGRG
jgi:uncharacterized protein with PIN domain